MIIRTLIASASCLALIALGSPSLAGTKYSYDSAGRLIQVEFSSGVTIRYSYDASGNRREISTAQLPNRSPVALSDNASALVSGTVDIPVLKNDSDPDRHPLTVTAVSAVSGGGTATIMGNGAYVRYAAPATAGTKTFTYTVSDGNGKTATATVSIVVTAAPNQPPIAVNDTASVMVSGAVDILVRDNDSDPNGDNLTVTAVSAVSGGGSVAIQGGGSHVRYTAPTTAGVKTFTYTISDGKGGTATATVTVTVNAPVNNVPIAVNDEAEVERSASIAIMVRANDYDPDGDSLTVTSVTQPTAGSVSIASGGSYVIFNAPSTIGIRTFSYTISDGKGGTATALVTVYITNACFGPSCGDPL